MAINGLPQNGVSDRDWVNLTTACGRGKNRYKKGRAHGSVGRGQGKNGVYSRKITRDREWALERCAPLTQRLILLESTPD